MDMDISMDIRVKSVDLGMYAKFHIHGKPTNRLFDKSKAVQDSSARRQLLVVVAGTRR